MNELVDKFKSEILEQTTLPDKRMMRKLVRLYVEGYRQTLSPMQAIQLESDCIVAASEHMEANVPAPLKACTTEEALEKLDINGSIFGGLFVRDGGRIFMRIRYSRSQKEWTELAYDPNLVLTIIEGNLPHEGAMIGGVFYKNPPGKYISAYIHTTYLRLRKELADAQKECMRYNPERSPNYIRNYLRMLILGCSPKADIEELVDLPPMTPEELERWKLNEEMFYIWLCRVKKGMFGVSYKDTYKFAIQFFTHTGGTYKSSWLGLSGGYDGLFSTLLGSDVVHMGSSLDEFLDLEKNTSVLRYVACIYDDPQRCYEEDIRDGFKKVITCPVVDVRVFHTQRTVPIRVECNILLVCNHESLNVEDDNTSRRLYKIHGVERKLFAYKGILTWDNFFSRVWQNINEHEDLDAHFTKEFWSKINAIQDVECRRIGMVEQFIAENYDPAKSKIDEPNVGMLFEHFKVWAKSQSSSQKVVTMSKTGFFDKLTTMSNQGRIGKIGCPSNVSMATVPVARKEG